MMKTEAEFAILGKLLVESIEAVNRTGVETLSLGYGSVELRMPLKGNENHVNMMYAGSLFALAELPGGAVFLSVVDPLKYYPVIGELSIRYVKPATSDVTVKSIIAEAEIARIQNELEQTGKTTYILEQELLDSRGEVVAITRGTYMGRAH